MKNKNNLGCGKKFKIINGKYKEVLKDCDFICGVANAWGYERLCFNCKNKLKKKWKKEETNERGCKK